VRPKVAADVAPEVDWRDWRLAAAPRRGLGRRARARPAAHEGSRRSPARRGPGTPAPHHAVLPVPRRSRRPRVPIRRQCVPDAREADTVAGDLADPLGEEATRSRRTSCSVTGPGAPPGDGPAPSTAASVRGRASSAAGTGRCRSRRWTGARLAPRSPRGPRRHPQRRRPPRDGHDRLVRVVAPSAACPASRPSAWPHASRLTLPMRVTPELLSCLRPHHPLWVMTHFNHPAS